MTTPSLLPSGLPPRFWPFFGLALAIRLATLTLGCHLATLPPDIGPTDDPVPLRIRDEIRSGPAYRLEPWYRWDAVWYINIAENGYARAADRGGRLGGAFLPAMPICLAATRALGLEPFWTTILLVNVVAAAGSAIFARVAFQLTGNRAIANRAFVLLLAFPSAFFYSAPYNEAFGLLFLTLTMSSYLDGRAVRAGVFAALGSLARMTGAAVAVAAVGSWLLEDRSRRGARTALCLATGAIGGLLLFWGYLGLVMGNMFAGLESQAAWGRKGLSVWNPWLAIESVTDPRFTGGEAIAVVVFTMLGIRSWIRRGAFWGLLTLVPIGQLMMSGSLLSAHRIVLAALPAFIELADLLRVRSLYWIIVTGFVLAQLRLMHWYLHWIFAG
jgi:hypothetical protein